MILPFTGTTTSRSGLLGGLGSEATRAPTACRGTTSACWRRTSCQRLGLTLAGFVVARKSRRSRSTSSGRSIGRKWPAPSTISRRLPGISSWAMWAWLDGDHLVAVAPDDHRGHLVGEVEAVAGADPLAGDVDDGADRVDEGPLGPHVGEAGPRAPHLAEERVGPQPEAAERRGRPRRATSCSSWRRTTGSTNSVPGTVRTRRSGLTSLPRPPLPTSTRRSRHLRELVGELHGDAAAEAVADDRGALVAEHAEEVADAGGVGAEAVVAARLGALAVAEQVGRDHGVALGEQRHHRHPGAGAARRCRGSSRAADPRRPAGRRRRGRGPSSTGWWRPRGPARCGRHRGRAAARPSASGAGRWCDGSDWWPWGPEATSGRWGRRTHRGVVERWHPRAAVWVDGGS